MASGQHADALKLSPQDLKRSGEKELPGAPIVHVEKVEEDTPGPETKSKEVPQPAHHKPAVTHETDSVKTTVTDEDDTEASFVDKVKGKVSQIGDKLRPSSAVHAKEEDPHPSLT